MKLSETIHAVTQKTSSLYRRRTLSAYRSVYSSIFSLTKEDRETGTLFNSQWILEYQAFLSHRGLKRNTISFYMRTLRSIYYKAVDMGLHVNVPNLFCKVFTGTVPTTKRFVEPGIINRISQAKLTGTMEFTRDIFMLSFYFQGMAFVDLAYLKKTDLQYGYITYYRRKTNSQITIKVPPQAIRILKKYATQVKDSAYLVPIITDPTKDDYTQYQSALRSQNRRLKALAKLLGLEVTLSTYVARHSWATMAYRNRVPTATISEAMGHKTEQVTRIYLASLNRETISQANETVIKALKLEAKERRLKKDCPSLGKRRTEI